MARWPRRVRAVALSSNHLARLQIMRHQLRIEDFREFDHHHRPQRKSYPNSVLGTHSPVSSSGVQDLLQYWPTTSSPLKTWGHAWQLVGNSSSAQATHWLSHSGGCGESVMHEI
mmetsp:Transcript_5676/g.16811  ORF Transcript_5676/g.16811 Transcript_5676/m.16811 type:complete len:114 (+) Transcript_5676:161-502(+)